MPNSQANVNIKCKEGMRARCSKAESTSNFITKFSRADGLFFGTQDDYFNYSLVKTSPNQSLSKALGFGSMLVTTTRTTSLGD